MGVVEAVIAGLLVVAVGVLDCVVKFCPTLTPLACITYTKETIGILDIESLINVLGIHVTCTLPNPGIFCTGIACKPGMLGIWIIFAAFAGRN